MTYKQLGSIISRMSVNEANQDVTIYLTGIVELFGIERVSVIKDNDDIADVVDPGSIVLEVRDGN